MMFNIVQGASGRANSRTNRASGRTSKGISVVCQFLVDG